MSETNKREDSEDRAKRFVYTDDEWKESMLLNPKPLNIEKLKRKLGKKKK